VRPTGNVSYDSFNGDIEFNVNNNESERWISPKNSYLSIRVRIVQSDETGALGTLAPIVNAGANKAGATLVSIPYINANAGASLFQAASFNIGDENISNNQNIAQCNTLYRMLYESKSEQETVNSTNPIKLMNIKETDTIGVTKTAVLGDYFATAYGGGTALTNRKVWALNNMSDFNKYYEVEITTQCLTPFMYSDDLIAPNTPFSLRLTADPFYHLNLINIAGSNVSSLPTGGPVNFTITRLTDATHFASPNANNYNTIGVGIVDINLYLYRVHMPNAVSIPKEIYVKNYSSTLHAITSGTHDEFNVDFKKNRRITHIACAFVQKKGSIKCCPTDFSSGFYIGADSGAGVDTANAAATTEAIVYSASPIVQLQNIRIEYAGSVYPFQPYDYNFDYRGVIDTTKASKGTFRSITDFYNFSDALRDRAGHLMSAENCLVSPIILFKTFQNPDNDGNTCICSVDFKNSVSNCYLLVMAFYDEVCKLSFDQYAKYKGFEMY
jgi:hypothetical protein